MEQKKEISIETRFVTPEMALELLKFNTRNRPMNQAHVLELVAEIEGGRWVFNAEPIQFSSDGVLLNGQHRLAAIVKSKIGQELVLIQGLDKESFQTFDVGKKRSAGDLFSVNEIASSKNSAATLKAYLTLKSGRAVSDKLTGSTGTKITNSIILNEYRLRPSLFDSIVKNAQSDYAKLKMMTVSEIGGYMAYLIIEKRHPEEKVYSFFHQLFYADGVENSTINALREKLVNAKMTNYKMTSRYRKALIIKTWNAFVQGKELVRLSFNEIKDIYPEFM